MTMDRNEHFDFSQNSGFSNSFVYNFNLDQNETIYINYDFSVVGPAGSPANAIRFHLLRSPQFGSTYYTYDSEDLFLDSSQSGLVTLNATSLRSNRLIISYGGNSFGANSDLETTRILNSTISFGVVPEPATYSFILGASALAWIATRRRRS